MSTIGTGFTTGLHARCDCYSLVIADKRLWDEEEMGPITDVKDVSVGEVFTKVGTTVVYEYDFGYGWMHHLELVGTYPFTRRKR